MRIAVFGTGYVGLVTGTCFSELGNSVTCFDVNAEKIESLGKGSIPIYEPGLSEMVTRNTDAGRLRFSSSAADALEGAEIVFLAVGTPQQQNGSADLRYIFDAARMIASEANRSLIVVTKSTVPPGTAEKVAEILADSADGVTLSVASNPEFLREGSAVHDFMNPSRVTVGLGTEADKEPFERLYSGITGPDRPLIFTDIVTAEITKYASNAFLATKISFINQISQLCSAMGGNVKDVAESMGWDSRIGSSFLNAGIGYGGSCFPKDVRALHHAAREAGVDFSLLREVEEINERQKRLPISFLERHFHRIDGLKVAVWGITFKPETDDIRESPALTVIEEILGRGASVAAYDPKGMEAAKPLFSGTIAFCSTAEEAARGSDALLILTDWQEFAAADLNSIASSMRMPKLFDGRNMLDPGPARAAGFEYEGVGIPT